MTDRSPRRPRRVPTVLQMDAMECGAACLAMVLAAYRLWVPLRELREACGVSRNGASAAALLRAADQYGMRGRGLRINADAVGTLALPLIAFWGGDHFVVVERHGRRGTVVNDPATGRRRLSPADFARLFSGIVLEMTPSATFRSGGHPPPVFRTLLDYARPDRVGIAVVAAYAALLVVPGMVVPAALKAFTDDVLLRRLGDWLLPIIVTLVLAAAAAGAMSWLQQLCQIRIEAALSNRIAARTARHVLDLPYLWFTQRHPADVAARVGLCGQLGLLLSGPLPSGLLGLLTAVPFTVMLAIYSVPLVAIALGMCGVGIALGALRLRVRLDQNAGLLEAQARLAAVSVGGVAAIETLKASGGEDDHFRRWSGQQAAFAGLLQRQAETQLWLSLPPQMIAAATPAVVAGAGAWLILQGELTIGGLLAFQVVLAQVTGPLQNLPGLVGQFQQAKALLLRIGDLLDYPRQAMPSAASIDPADVRSRGAITFQNVTAGYGPGTPDVLHDISFAVEPGERVAFVGGSGSGKSTLLRLLSNTIQPRTGRVLLDGVDVRAMPPAAIQSALGVVEQDAFVFAGTAFENLTLWDDAADPITVTEAAQQAELHAVLAAMPGGYQAVLEEGGGNLSGGQRQRLEIARALVSDPAVLVMDEATSALDPSSEQLVMGNIRRRGCSCVIVAHRLSTVRDCDRIHVLEAGRIVESGNHATLLARGGRYTRLVAAS